MMKKIKEGFLEILHTDRRVFLLMIETFIFSLGVFIFSLTRIDTTSSVIKIGYGDIGGYRDGAWYNMFAFPLIIFLFGILHNLLAIKIFQKRGSGMTKFFLISTIILIFSTLLVLIRLSNEG